MPSPLGQQKALVSIECLLEHCLLKVIYSLPFNMYAHHIQITLRLLSFLERKNDSNQNNLFFCKHDKKWVQKGIQESTEIQNRKQIGILFHKARHLRN